MSFLEQYAPRQPFGDPFKALPLQRRPQPAPAPEDTQPQHLPRFHVEAPREAVTAPQDFARAIAALGLPEDQGSEVAAALERAERSMRNLPPVPRDDYASRTPPRRAMTPMEGPDTGEENPNAGYLASLRGAESGNNPTARNKVTDAGGLYQALADTWAGAMREAPHLGLTPEGRTSGTPEGIAQQERFGRWYTDKSMRQLMSYLGRRPTKGELYALHFLGHTGGMQLLHGLDRPTEEVVSEAAIRANPWLNSYVGKPASSLLGRLERMMGS